MKNPVNILLVKTFSEIISSESERITLVYCVLYPRCILLPFLPTKPAANDTDHHISTPLDCHCDQDSLNPTNS